MCLAIPMQISTINGYNATCEAKGITRDISLFMLHDDLPGVGDFVMVQTGYAVRRVSPDEARQSWELFDQILGEITPPSL